MVTTMAARSKGLWPKGKCQMQSENCKGKSQREDLCAPHIALCPCLFALSRRYSYLNDSIGSNRAAFHAGHNPKMIPILAEMPTPTPIAHAGT